MSKFRASTIATCFFFMCFNVFAQYKPFVANKYSKSDTIWAENIIKSMTLEEKIGQLLIIRCFSNKDQVYETEIINQILKYNIGGVCFFQGSPTSQISLINRFNKISKIPILTAIDGEYGLGMRLENTIVFPRQMTLGASANDTMAYLMGKEIARQCRKTGIYMNFAPVVDINNNPNNPVINSRSFGSDKYLVTKMALAYMKGMQDGGIAACAKHFPGHGDTETDSHLSLPTILHNKETIQNLDLFPFKELINQQVASIMIAHLFVPALDSDTNSISTMSKKIIDSLLIKKMNFTGLVITDALEMKGAQKYSPPGQIEVKALQAGNDLLLLPSDLEVVVKSIKKAIHQNTISEKEIDKKCLKVLLLKNKLINNNNIKPDTTNILSELNSEFGQVLQKKIFEKSITTLINNNQIIPLKRLDTLNIKLISFNLAKENYFHNTLNLYKTIDCINVNLLDSSSQDKLRLEEISDANLIIISIQNTNQLADKNYGVNTEVFNLINKIKEKKKIILCIIGNPYILQGIKDLTNIESILVSYQSNKITEELTAQAIFGGIGTSGRLPVDVPPFFQFNQGFNTSTSRLKYVMPTELGIEKVYINKLDSIAKAGIERKAYPGCQILLAYKGNVFYNKSFGTPIYDSSITVTNINLYDIASLTKIIATTPSLMKLYDKKLFDVDAHLNYYLKELNNTNKENIKLRSLLAHQAKLKAWIPFYSRTLINGKRDSTIYQSYKTDSFNIEVAENIFLKQTYIDTIFARINLSELNHRKKYKYSDLGFYYLMQIIEKQTQTKLNDYVMETFYKPLGMDNTCYLPLMRFEKSRIIPSENDTLFRKQILQGYVNDPGAAMIGGVCGHAGLFSNANDVAKIMQMYLWNGVYGSEKYIEASTIKEFTRQQYPENHNRRALGFDKPIGGNESGQTCKSATNSSFGHSGFTGTFTWADPETSILYVFLSNRTYPFATNKLINELDIRAQIQQVAYDAIKNAKPLLIK